MAEILAVHCSSSFDRSIFAKSSEVLIIGVSITDRSLANNSIVPRTALSCSVWNLTSNKQESSNFEPHAFIFRMRAHRKQQKSRNRKSS